MVSEKTTVINKSGLHLTPAADLAKLAGKFKCSITINAGEKRVNPKSVLMLMGAEITQGTDIELVCDGEDEKEALEALLDAINSGLGEM